VKTVFGVEFTLDLITHILYIYILKYVHNMTVVSKFGQTASKPIVVHAIYLMRLIAPLYSYLRKSKKEPHKQCSELESSRDLGCSDPLMYLVII
jgi:hypothetical protein